MIRRREPIKKSVKVLICVAILVLFIAGNIYFRGYTVYTFSPQSCEYYFGNTPQVMSTEIDGASTTYTLDDDNNLVMRFSNLEITLMKIMYKYYLLDSRIYGIDIDSDYSLIEFECEEWTDECITKVSNARIACTWLRLLNNEEKLDFEMRLVEQSSGEIITRDITDYGYTYEKHNIFTSLNSD